MSRSLTALGLALLLSGGIEVRAAPGAAKPEAAEPLLLIAGGPMRIEAGRRLRLRLEVADPPPFWSAMRAVTHRLAPAAPVGPSTASTAPVVVELRWRDPVAAPLSLRFEGGLATIDVPAGPPRTGRYSLVWSDPAGRAEVRLPADAAGFPVEIVAPGASTIISATGSVDLEVFGEELPIGFEIADPRGISGAMVFHRSAPATTFATAAMRLDAGTPDRGIWKAALPRPEGAEATVEYYVEIINSAGARTLSGSAGVPYRLYLPDPTAPR